MSSLCLQVPVGFPGTASVHPEPFDCLSLSSSLFTVNTEVVEYLPPSAEKSAHNALILPLIKLLASLHHGYKTNIKV